MSERLAAAATLAGIVLAAAALWGALGQQIDVPTVFGDELIHWDAARSLADGHGLRVRDGGYGFGPVYPALLAPVHVLAGDDLSAYRWARILNAVLFALAAIPAYLLARRLLTPTTSLVCAALAVLAPSALYTGFVMAEGAAYAACTLALLAFARCLERPTTAAQLFALATLGLATTVRLQLASLGVALVGALPVRGVLTRGRGLPTRRELTRLWPLLGVLGAAAFALAVRAALGNPLGGYGDLWRSYDLGSVATWTWRSLSGLGLYFALVPVVVAPGALVGLSRAARRGDRAAAAFVALFLSVDVVLLLVVGAFSSTEFGVGFLHDRYLFYVVPLWLILVAAWIERRLPLSAASLAAGAVLVLVLLATLPTYLVNDDGGRRFDSIAGALPSEAAVRLGGVPAPPRWALLAVGLVAVALTILATRTPALRWLVLLPVAVVFALNAAIAWNTRLDDGRNATFAPLAARTVSWVDRAVPAGADVAVLSGGVSIETRDALRLTEFFNGSIGPTYDLDGGYAPTLASSGAHVDGEGFVSGDAGRLDLRWVVAPRELELVGRPVAEGTVARLRLWRVSGPVRLAEGAR